MNYDDHSVRESMRLGEVEKMKKKKSKFFFTRFHFPAFYTLHTLPAADELERREHFFQCYHRRLALACCVFTLNEIISVAARALFHGRFSFLFSISSSCFTFSGVSGITSNKASQKVLILFLPFHVSCFMRRIWFL